MTGKRSFLSSTLVALLYIVFFAQLSKNACRNIEKRRASSDHNILVDSEIRKN